MHSFLTKVHRITLVLNKMERAFIDKTFRQTNFEITAADKKNPTTITLKPVPTVRAYNPNPAFWWAMAQIAAVAHGEEPDQRIRSDIANDLVKLATKETEDGYKAFWINGHSENVRFDEDFLEKATALARKRTREESPPGWRVGSAIGSVTGELKKVDDLDEEREFVIVPRIGADAITCTFPDSLRHDMGKYLFKIVRVEGTLHYGENSPFPYRVDAKPEGIEIFPRQPPRRSLSELRGVFGGLPHPVIDLDDALNAD